MISFLDFQISWTTADGSICRLKFPLEHVDEMSGIFHTQDGLGLGAIAIIENSAGQFVICKKAGVSGYEFSNKLVFPGGAIRRTNETSDSDLLTYTTESLTTRVSSEAGVDLDLKNATFADRPVFTKYTAKGRLRFMMVVPFIVSLNEAGQLRANDESIGEAFFTQANEELICEMAPANALALIRYKPDLLAGNNLQFAILEDRSNKISRQFLSPQES